MVPAVRADKVVATEGLRLDILATFGIGGSWGAFCPEYVGAGSFGVRLCGVCGGDV